MSDTGKQSPLGANFLNALLVDNGLKINTYFKNLVGTSSVLAGGYSFGSVVQNTVLKNLTYAIHEAYVGNPSGKPSNEVYNNLISIGGQTNPINITSITSTTDTFTILYNGNVTISSGSYILINGATPAGYNGAWRISSSTDTTLTIEDTNNYGTASIPGYFIYSVKIPGLGNSKPFTYTWEQPIGPYGVGPNWDNQGWGGSEYKALNPATSWGFLRLLALQTEAEWNYNNTQPEFRDFLGSFLNAHGFIEYSNQAILSVSNSLNYMEGTFSQMSDLITADITAVSKATPVWGQDLVRLGKALDLTTIDTFGLPSNLLKLLNDNNAITPSVSLALVAAGIPVNEINLIANGEVKSFNIERKLYGAFSVIVGESLREVKLILRCKTEGLESLIDLLNPKKLFPNSYKTFTVPIYNDVTIIETSIPSTPNFPNSRRPILIYDNSGGVNSELLLPTVSNKVGYLLPSGIPSVIDQANGDANSINLPLNANVGLASNTVNILPADIAYAAGAFAVSMSQIRNIKNVPIEKFAQVVYNLEVVNNNVTPNIDGTNVPINKPLRANALPLIALGSGPKGTYTVSDFFGCTSGLPYNGPLTIIEKSIPQLTTAFLEKTYNNLFLAVTWDKPTVTCSTTIVYTLVSPYSPGNPAVWNVSYRISGVTIISSGGGYRRENANNPVATVLDSSNAAISLIAGNDPDTAPNQYGRILSGSVINPGSLVFIQQTTVNSTDTPTGFVGPTVNVRVESPPISAAQGKGDSTIGVNSAYNTVGWPYMNSVVQQYIDYANQEISEISSNPNNVVYIDRLNSSWNQIGLQLSIEQRARQTGLKPKLIFPRDSNLYAFPEIQYQFVDEMPIFSARTEPHMYSQTIQAIADLDTVGGQSSIGLLSESRNQLRLNETGIVLDNNITDKISPTDESTLIANGTLFSDGQFTPLATLTNFVGDNPVTPSPYGYYDEIRDTYVITDPELQGDLNTGSGGINQSPYVNIIPPNLNTFYFSRNLLPSTYNKDDAIKNVNLCRHGPINYVPYQNYREPIIGSVPPNLLTVAPAPISEPLAQPPIANFIGIPLTGMGSLTVNFTDLSTNNPTTWAWDFTNDGTIDSTVQNPSYTYTEPGIYSVKLYVTNSQGGSSLLRSFYVIVEENSFYDLDCGIMPSVTPVASDGYTLSELGPPDPANTIYTVQNRFIIYKINGYGSGALGGGNNNSPSIIGLRFDPTGNSNYGLDDYIQPGTPWEGYSALVNNTTYIRGSNSDLYPAATTWQLASNHVITKIGNLTDGIVLCQYMTIGDEPVIRVKMSYTNTTATNKTVKMMRGIDPDVDNFQYGSFNTTNTRGAGPIPTSDIVLAVGTFSGKPIAMFIPGNGYTHNTGVYSSWPTYNPDIPLNGANDIGTNDNGLVVGWNMGTVLPGETATVCLYYIMADNVNEIITIIDPDYTPPPPPPPPPPAPTPFTAAPVTIPVTLRAVPEAGLTNVYLNVAWYSFTLTTTTTLTFDTEGSTVVDTEIGVYNQAGVLVSSDDDSGTGNLSYIRLVNMAAGTYYVAVGYYNTTFNSTSFDASSGVTMTPGNIKLNIFQS